MNKKRKQIIASNDISELYTFSLTGIPQKVLIEGKSNNLPIVISLHGGPGTPIPFSVGCRGLFPEFTDEFIMVYWDQLGCGINNYTLGSDASIDSYVTMTADLIMAVRRLFPHNPLILLGMSWGSVLTAKVMQQVPGQVNAVLVWGQIVNNLFFNHEIYNLLEEKRLPKKKMNRIRSINPENITLNDLMFFTGCIRKYTNGYQNREDDSAPIAPVIKGLLTSPDYSFKDFKAIMINNCMKSERLWSELLAIDLSEILINISVPYYILQGDTDVVASTTNVTHLVKRANNLNLHCNIVKNSGHIPGKTGMFEVLAKLKYMKESLFAEPIRKNK